MVFTCPPNHGRVWLVVERRVWRKTFGYAPHTERLVQVIWKF